MIKVVQEELFDACLKVPEVRPSVKMFEAQFGTVAETINRIYKLGHF